MEPSRARNLNAGAAFESLSPVQPLQQMSSPPPPTSVADLREQIVTNPDYAKSLYETLQYYARIYGTQPPTSPQRITPSDVIVIGMSAVLLISNSKRSCA